MKWILSISTILLFLTATIAQTIKGKIVAKPHVPIEFATVVLQTPDAVYVNSVVSDSLGNFTILSDLQEYQLIVQHLLYETKNQRGFTPDAGIIELVEKENSLATSVIKGRQTVMKVIDGKLTYDMPRLLDGKIISNAYESILQLPGVREQEGILILAGANSLTLIINGKPSSMTPEQISNLLKAMPQSNVEKAEVMYNSPPQYHVRGAAINLILKTRNTEVPNLQSQINLSYSQKHYANFAHGFNLLYTSARLSADFMYTIQQDYKRTGIDLYSFHTLNNVVDSIAQYNRGSSKVLTHNIRFGSDYTLSNDTKISMAYTAQLSPMSDKEEQSEGDVAHSFTTKKAESPIQMHNIALDYTARFGITAGANYTYYKNQLSQNFRRIQDQTVTAFASNSDQKIDRLNVYLNKNHELTTNWKLNYGVKFAAAKDASAQSYHSTTGSDLSSLNSSSQLNEYTYSLYAGFEANFSEHFSMKAALEGSYDQFGELNEWSVFPSLSATYLFSPRHVLQLSVSSNKMYPSYWEMNGSVSYLNGYAEVHGNPALRPYNDYSTQLNYIIQGKYVITGFYSYQDQYFAQLPYQASDRLALIYQTTNFDYKQTLGMNVLIPFSIGSLNSRLTLTGFHDKVKNRYFHNQSFNKSIWVAYLRLDNSIQLTSQPDIKMEVSMAYITPNIQGPSKLSRISSVDAGIKWTFAQKKAELRCKGTDLWNTWSPNMEMKYANQNLRMELIPDSRAVNVSLSYKFGGYKDKLIKSVNTSRFGQ